MGPGEHAEPHENSAAARLPRRRDLLAALGLLTALPFDRPDIRSAGAAPATLFFPAVGGLIGLLLMGCNWILGERLPAALSAIVLVGLWEWISGGAALEAWVGRRPASLQRDRSPFDSRATGSESASHSRPSGAEPEDIGMQEDSRHNGADLQEPGASPGAAALGRRGLVLMAAVLLMKVALLSSSVASRPAALLFAPMLARWAMVVLAVGARDVVAPARKLNAAITFREFALSSVFTCAVVFTVAEAFGILLVVGVAALTLALRRLQHRGGSGTSWALLLACAELAELLVLAIAAAVLSAEG